MKSKCQRPQAKVYENTVLFIHYVWLTAAFARPDQSWGVMGETM